MTINCIKPIHTLFTKVNLAFDPVIVKPLYNRLVKPRLGNDFTSGSDSLFTRNMMQLGALSGPVFMMLTGTCYHFLVRAIDPNITWLGCVTTCMLLMYMTGAMVGGLLANCCTGTRV